MRSVERQALRHPLCLALGTGLDWDDKGLAKTRFLI